jgi:hypothetical protein
MSEFFVGYLPKAPPGIARLIRIVVASLLLLAAVGAILFARVQRTFAPSVFEYGKVNTFEGLIESSPYPILVVTRPGVSGAGPASSRYLLVAEGKHGANNQVAGYDGKTVKLRGTLIYRDHQTMIELVSGSISTMDSTTKLLQAAAELGTFELTGEIVDTKCYLGVMNPGNGKVHRDCAVRCLSGGIPPAFVTNNLDGSPAILLLTDQSQHALSKEAFLQHIAQPVRIRGKVLQSSDTFYLQTSSEGITLLR